VDVKPAGQEHAPYMARALELARRGSGTAYPNPMVGAVVVQGSDVVGEGWHERFGGPHAEVQALRHAGAAARGGVLYVTLEPCTHHGRTPPCTDAVIAAGITRVVFAAEDPNPLARGGGALLRDAGIDVVGGVEREAARSLNGAFFHVHEHAGPFVALKLAISLDGGIAAGPGVRTQITGEAIAEQTHRLRAQHDAIVIGSRTALIDDPLLTVRGIDAVQAPVRVVLDSAAALPVDSQLVRTVTEAGVVVLCAESAAAARVGALRDAGVTVMALPGAGPRLDLRAALAALHEIGVTTVLAEGGATLASALIDEGLVDRLYLLVAPRFLGAAAVPAFRVARPARWICRRSDGHGGDVLLTLDPTPPSQEAH
jgi:diaminohydroxyphosphoribosylaminopyrimidine deaminase / 5-amino-6-(5-phosphoribosylamino)uracil reductase